MNLKDIYNSFIDSKKIPAYLREQPPVSTEPKKSENREVKLYENYFHDFYFSCPPDVQARYREKFGLLKATQGILGSNLIKPIKTGLFELRVSARDGIFRTFLTFEKGNIVVLFNSYMKKTQKADPNEIKRAERLVNEFHANKGSLNDLDENNEPVKMQDSVEKDEAVEEAERIFEEYKRGEGKLYDADFLELDNVPIQQEVTDSVCSLPEGFDFYIETEDVYQKGKLYACNVYVWCGESTDIEKMKEIEEVSEEKGFIVVTKKVAFTSHLASDVYSWVDEFCNITLDEHGVYCHVEYLC